MDAARIRALAAKLRLPLVLADLGLLAGAAVVGVTAVRAAGIPDWYMHLAMWVVLAVYLLLAVRGIAAGRRVGTTANTVLFDALAVFWMVILAGKVPAERMAVQGALMQREPLEVLWLSVGCLGLCVLVTLALAVLTFLLQERR